MSDLKLSILHDHYKESFSFIREREKNRDRMFLVIVGLMGALFFVNKYPGQLPSGLEVNAAVTKFNLNRLPVEVVVSALWTIFLAYSLRYCQSIVWLERQYTYLHLLEEKISQLLGDPEVYRREGKIYNEDYPMVSWWVWGVYTLLFPGIMIVTTIALLWVEWENKTMPRAFLWYDLILASGVIVTFVLYRFWPLAEKSWKLYTDKFCKRRSSG